MARLQILELPMVHNGDQTETPFVLVIDQADDGLADEIRNWPDDIARRVGARQVLSFAGTVDIPANDTSAYAAMTHAEPDFTGPLTGIEVRRPCPHCDDQQMIPRSQFAEHVARLHPDQPAVDA
ncbi:hypothetical protein OG785_45675 [Streptomyces sp. NBC_00006]|uniref:hypothetical protein n=1 Tax=Streptomyces sp. NBC_00006 TaxID=2975619 RepID=UPI00224EAFB0|nr:hypothetical protein [Streptomyces sp. NBC_00006]MCX5537738.1 hypothetical protein [Streptomyces sp. NBC_00006]MCX5537851.1 hypothetical protein [Streptomyces sp. NBC_00006]